jgi:hypothetical protein
VQRLRAADVQRGDRIEIDDGMQVLRFKLAWVSPSRSLYVLSRFPDQARSLAVAELAAMFDAGRARVVERRSSVEQAIGMIAAAPGMVSTPRLH